MNWIRFIRRQRANVYCSSTCRIPRIVDRNIISKTVEIRFKTTYSENMTKLRSPRCLPYRRPNALSKVDVEIARTAQPATATPPYSSATLLTSVQQKNLKTNFQIKIRRSFLIFNWKHQKHLWESCVKIFYSCHKRVLFYGSTLLFTLAPRKTYLKRTLDRCYWNCSNSNLAFIYWPAQRSRSKLLLDR